MWGYVTGSVLTLLTAIVLQLFGICICKQKKSFSYSFVIGYLVYSFFVAIGAIPIQILNLPWITFFVYMLLVLVAILAFIIFNIYKKNIQINSNVIKDYIKENWFIYVGSILLVAFALTHISIIWLNNMSDDAYYLTKMATLPYLENPFRTDYSTGFIHPELSSYVLNTFEVEASFYIFITQMDPSLYARCFLAMLNYFVLLNVIKAFLEEFFNRIKFTFNTIKLQYYVLTLFVFFVLSSTFFITTDAQWTIISAAYYGSAIERISCIFLVLLPLLDFKSLDLKKILYIFVVSVVMVSKSTIAVPLLLLLAIGFLSVFLMQRNRKYFFVLVLLVVILGFILPGDEKIDAAMVSNIRDNFDNYLIILSSILLFVGAIKYKVIRNIFILLVSIFLLMLIPEVNDVIELFMQYDFVAGRTIYSILVFLLVISYGTGIIILYNKMFKDKLALLINGVLVFSVFFVSSLYTFEWTYPVKAWNTLKMNINLIPDSTILLGEKFEKYYDETGEVLNMVMTPGVFVNGLGHFSSQIVRAYSPHIISVTAGLRMSEEVLNSNTVFDGFSVDDVEQFNLFFANPTYESLYNVQKLCDEYPIDCIVSNIPSDMTTTLLQEIGFEFYDSVTDPQAEPAITYTIYVKK